MTVIDPRLVARMRGRRPAREEPPGPVLVTFDAGSSGRGAFTWAAAEAASRGSGLRAVRSVFISLVPATAWTSSTPSTPTTPWTPWYGWYPVAASDASSQGEIAYTAAREDLAAAVLEARAIDPRLEVSTDLRAGLSPTAVSEVRGYSLAVVARGVRRRRSGGDVPRAPWRTVRRAGVPLAVVELADEPDPGPSVTRVVVVLRTGADPAPVLDAGFRAAARRQTGLTLLYAWDRYVVDDLLVPYREVFSEVPVRLRRAGSRVRDVAAESRGAAVTVIGFPARAAAVAERTRTRWLVNATRGTVLLVPTGRVARGGEVSS